MDPMIWSQVRHLYEVEHLSIRQIAKKLRMARKTVSKIIRNERVLRSYPDSILRPYERLIDQVVSGVSIFEGFSGLPTAKEL